MPPPSPLEAIKLNPEMGTGFVNILALDISEYAKKHGTQTVKETFEIPAYLSNFAKTQHLNIPEMLGQSLSEHYRKHIHA